MVKFFKVGPIHFLPKMYHQILALVSTALFLLFKGVALAVMIYSASATFPALLTTYNNTLLARENPCPSVTFVKKDEGRKWKTLRHMHVVLNTSLQSKWNFNPKYAPPGTKWIYFYEDESKVGEYQKIRPDQEITKNKMISDHVHSRKQQLSWNSSRLYGRFIQLQDINVL